MRDRRGSIFRGTGIAALLVLAALAIFLALPQSERFRELTVFRCAAWAVLIGFAAVAVQALFARAWVRALFAAGAVCVTVGFGVTGASAREGALVLTDSLSPYANHRLLRERVVGGETVRLESFRQDTYPNGMPRQYTTLLRFPDGLREISVNRPYRRNGYTYYQMSCDGGVGPDGYPFVQTVLTVRRDPGVPVVFVGFAMLLAASAALAVREVWR